MSRPKTNTLQFTYTLPRFYAGEILFVDSTYGSNSYRGNKPEKPLKSITYAMTKCVDDHDDLIIVLNGYDNDLTDAETNGDDTPIILNKNGVSVLFSGRNNSIRAIESGDSIFQITCNQGTLGVLNPQSDAVWILAAKSGTANTVVEITSASVDAEVYGLKTDSCDGYDELITIDATAHRAFIHDNYLIGDTTDTDEGIIIAGTNQETRIWDNTMFECCAGTAAISVAAAAVNVDVRRNYLHTLVASKYGLKCHASATGVAMYNFAAAHDSHESKAFTGAKVVWFENLVPSDIAKSGLLNPANA